MSAPGTIEKLGYKVEDIGPLNEVFDLILSDGLFKVKIVLSPSLNNKVYDGSLQVLDTIALRSWKAHSFHDKAIFPILEQFDVISKQNLGINFTNEQYPIKWKRTFMDATRKYLIARQKYIPIDTTK